MVTIIGHGKIANNPVLGWVEANMVNTAKAEASMANMAKVVDLHNTARMALEWVEAQVNMVDPHNMALEWAEVQVNMADKASVTIKVEVTNTECNPMDKVNNKKTCRLLNLNKLYNNSIYCLIP
jgi:hypothetical protein